MDGGGEAIEKMLNSDKMLNGDSLENTNDAPLVGGQPVITDQIRGIDYEAMKAQQEADNAKRANEIPPATTDNQGECVFCCCDVWADLVCDIVSDFLTCMCLKSCCENGGCDDCCTGGEGGAGCCDDCGDCGDCCDCGDCGDCGDCDCTD